MDDRTDHPHGHSHDGRVAHVHASVDHLANEFANWTRLDELREVVRHEAAHLWFARTHTAEESDGHSGPSEDFALAFETSG